MTESGNSIIKFANRAIPIGHEMSKIVKQMNYKLHGISNSGTRIKMQYGSFVDDNEQHEVFIEAIEDEFYVYFSKSDRVMYLLECSISDLDIVQVVGGSLAKFID